MEIDIWLKYGTYEKKTLLFNLRILIKLVFIMLSLAFCVCVGGICTKIK